MVRQIACFVVACLLAAGAAPTQAQEHLLTLGEGILSDGAAGVATTCCGDLIFVSDRNDHVIRVFDASGAHLSTFGSSGALPGEFNDPDGISITCDGLVYVADEDNGRVQVFDLDGNFVREIGGLSVPRGVAVTPDGLTTWIAERGANRVSSFDETGGHRLDITGLTEPFDVTARCPGTVHVADTIGNRIVAYDLDGNFLGEWPADTPAAIASNCRCDVFVGTRHEVLQFDRLGAFVRQWGEVGSGPGQFNVVAGLAADDTGLLYTVETLNQRVQVFRVGEAGTASAVLPSDVLVPCPAPASGPGSEADWLSSASLDFDGCGAPVLLHELVGSIPRCGGQANVFEFWIADACGDGPRQQRTFEVTDVDPPLLEVPIQTFSLWPPNHRRVVVSVDSLAQAVDACGVASLRAIRCSSSQPENVRGRRMADEAQGDGETLEDCVVAEDGSAFAVRAERLGACREPRTYVVTLEADDECGNAASEDVWIRVDHDRRGGALPVTSTLLPNEPLPFSDAGVTVYGTGCR